MMNERIRELEQNPQTPKELDEEDDKKVVKKVRFVEESSVSQSQDWDARLQEKENIIKDLQAQLGTISERDSLIKELQETKKSQNEQIAKLTDENKVSAYRV